MNGKLTLLGSAARFVLCLATATWAVGCGGEDYGKCTAGSSCGGPDAAGVTPRFARLTHAQWRNTVADLFDAADLPDYVATFRGDPREKGSLFDNNASTLAVDQALWQAYQRAATQLAAFVAGSDAHLSKIAPAAGTSAAMGRTFIEQFGERVYRRPLSDSEVQSYVALYSEGPKIFPEQSDFQAGVRLLIQAFLQSPHFLYRIESSATIKDGSVPLDGYETASRLSYALWDTMPDAALLSAAEAGGLSTPAAVAEQARRLLASPRAQPVLEHLHYQLLNVERYRAISRFPQEHLPDIAAEENRRFVQHILFTRDGSLKDLLTSTETFVNKPLAELYGLTGDFSADYQLVQLDPQQRSGFLTQVGFLASNANSGVPDPIHRGVFLARRMACINVPMPPPNIPPLPAANGRTNRETVTAHTEAPGTVCVGCHGQFINPFGFPFEYYDGLGRYRTEDNGHPVDGAASLALDEMPRVSNAIELAQALVASKQVHECYAKHLLEFTLGRLSGAEDEALIKQLAQSSQAQGMSIKELETQIVSSPSFLSRAVKESP
ncbi:MAG: DUF1592 domain-containing protein [Myxococcota bacterium]